MHYSTVVPIVTTMDRGNYGNGRRLKRLQGRMATKQDVQELIALISQDGQHRATVIKPLPAPVLGLGPVLAAIGLSVGILRHKWSR